MAFRIRFYTESAVLHKPLFGTVVFDDWRSRSMEGADASALSPPGSATLSPPVATLSRSAEAAPAPPAENEENLVFFAGNPEIDVSKGVLRLFKDNK